MISWVRTQKNHANGIIKHQDTKIQTKEKNKT